MTEKAEDERQQQLRQNSNVDSDNQSSDKDLNPMEPDSWSGGSINPDAKKVARGEIPRDRPAGPSQPPPGLPETPSESTRPWAPKGTEDEVDATGRPR